MTFKLLSCALWEGLSGHHAPLPAALLATWKPNVPFKHFLVIPYSGTAGSPKLGRHTHIAVQN